YRLWRQEWFNKLPLFIREFFKTHSNPHTIIGERGIYTYETSSMYAYIDVYEEPDGNTTIYLGFYYYDADDVYHSFWGEMTTTEDVFTVDKRLASASLSEVSIDGNYYTEEAGSSIGTANITADWTGVEDITKITYTVKDGTFYSVKGTSRDAIATGSIIDPEGNELIGDESTEYAYIELFNFLEIIRKK
ncbi:MAG: hypothetical protein ACC612_05095, partial [Methanomethylovorans sp.]|uniref:hypothetical protein n=1 Tax=Methanomethylovorans sp. TaxID=2758717 RepID=UPI00353158E0